MDLLVVLHNLEQVDQEYLLHILQAFQQILLVLVELEGNFLESVVLLMDLVDLLQILLQFLDQEDQALLT
jgi:hypothetical protein